jgi:branched-chain amino acid transport system ATP-binding protein
LAPRAWLFRVTGGLTAFPLLVLFGLYFFDQFDTGAFNTLAPDIERAFHLTDKTFGLIVIINASLVLLAAVPISHFGDRLPRTALVVAGGLAAGTFSFFTGIVSTVALLFAVRFGNGVGQVVNEPVHNSLLADYYLPDDRPAVFAFHRAARDVGLILGPIVAGWVAFVAGWRVAFMVLFGPVIVISLIALRLRNPRRGGTDHPVAVADAPVEQPLPFVGAFRTLLAVPTLRRQSIAAMLVGAGSVPIAFLIPLYMERELGAGAFARGVIGSADFVFELLGILVAARLTSARMRTRPGLGLRLAGLALAAVGLWIVVFALAPNLGVAAAATFGAYFTLGLFFPPFVTTQALVSPPRVRTLSFGLVLSLFPVVGIWALWIAPGVINVSDRAGLRWGLAALVPYWVLGGIVLASAGRFVAADAENIL